MNPIEGIHHITLITGDAPGNVDFYARVLGLRLVKKTVNQDDPGVYHLFYADENGSPGADITFFEYPGAAPGRAGAGMISRIVAPRGLRGGAGLLAGAPRRRGRRHRARARPPALRRSRGHGPRAGRRHHHRHPAERRSASRSRRSSRCRALRPCAPWSMTRPAARRCSARCSASPSAAPTTGRRAAASAAGGSSSSSPTSAGSPAPAPCTTSPGRVLNSEIDASGSATSTGPAPTPRR